MMYFCQKRRCMLLLLLSIVQISLILLPKPLYGFSHANALIPCRCPHHRVNTSASSGTYNNRYHFNNKYGSYSLLKYRTRTCSCSSGLTKNYQKLKMVRRGGSNIIVDVTTGGAGTVISSISSKVLSWLSRILGIIVSEINNLSRVQFALFGAVFWLGLPLGRAPFWKRYTVTSGIPSHLFGPNSKTMIGNSVKVVDGDTLRFRHVPTMFHSSRLKKGQKVSETCLPIRICSIDTPETAKFGKPNQPFGQEAKEFLAQLIENKVTRVRLLQKDQYGRAVAEVYAGGNWLWNNKRGVDELLLKAGLAEVYQGMGAVYGPLGKEAYLKLEEEARKKKIGIWSIKNRESAAEYKKRNK